MRTKKSLKIFVDGYLLNKEPQGTKTYIKELYKAVAVKNTETQIFIGCFKDAALELEFSSFKNIHFIYFKQKSRVVRMFLEIPKIIRAHQFSFAHFQYVIPFVRNKNCSYLVTIHDILFNDFTPYFSKLYRLKRNFLFRYSAKKATYLLTVSEYSKQRILEVYNLKNKPVYITPNGVNSEYFKPYDKGLAIDYIKKKFSIEHYILYVSRIEPRKNQQQLLKLFATIKQNDLSLVFIGKKSLENNELTTCYNQLSNELKERVHFLENIEEKDLIAFYRAAELFVYPSLAEGFGIPPIEAGALKIPVLCSNATAMNDFKFFNPFHIDFSNEKEVNLKFLSILKDRNIENLTDIQKKIKEKYSWQASSKVILNLIEKSENRN